MNVDTHTHTHTHTPFPGLLFRHSRELLEWGGGHVLGRCGLTTRLLRTTTRDCRSRRELLRVQAASAEVTFAAELKPGPHRTEKIL